MSSIGASTRPNTRASSKNTATTEMRIGNEVPQSKQDRVKQYSANVDKINKIKSTRSGTDSESNDKDDSQVSSGNELDLPFDQRLSTSTKMVIAKSKLEETNLSSTSSSSSSDHRYLKCLYKRIK